MAAQGSYESSSQVAVRRRPLNAQNGFWVMTLLRTEDGPVWVNRGWIPAGADAVIITVIVLASVGLSFANEYQAARAADAMAQRISQRCTVYRDGVALRIPVAELVRGDVVDIGLVSTDLLYFAAGTLDVALIPSIEFFRGDAYRLVSDACIGCRACMVACPYDQLFIDPNTRTAEKCNFCANRVENHLEPACVSVCPTECRIFGDLDDPETKVAQIVQREAFTVRKPEKGTGPKIFWQ